MVTKKSILFTAFLLLLNFWADAQEAARPKPSLALEARISTYLQGGYDLAVFYHPPNTRFSVGMLVAGHAINGFAKELIFTSSQYEDLDMRLSWIVSLQTRYHWARHKEGFFGEVGVGAEEFRVAFGSETFSHVNGFLAPAVGYTWHPWQRDGLYLMPKVASVLTVFRADEQPIGETSYRLRPFFLSPSLTVGWKF
ncbi:hypothetical protein ACO2Q8_17220 [Larkinella sp. VNQ87]|uniref:hypothetical protein n=1 Tax=Larkinella sp. VNQ87 TaxID=3400921 RepID=UPI003C07050B